MVYRAHLPNHPFHYADLARMVRLRWRDSEGDVMDKRISVALLEHTCASCIVNGMNHRDMFLRQAHASSPTVALFRDFAVLGCDCSSRICFRKFGIV